MDVGSKDMARVIEIAIVATIQDTNDAGKVTGHRRAQRVFSEADLDDRTLAQVAEDIAAAAEARSKEVPR